MEKTKLKIRDEFTYLDLLELRDYINQIIDEKVQGGYGLSDDEIICLYNQVKKEKLIELWLDAEEELRNGNDNKCIEMKDSFSEQLVKLNKEEQEYVKDYLDSCGA